MSDIRDVAGVHQGTWLDVFVLLMQAVAFAEASERIKRQFAELEANVQREYDEAREFLHHHPMHSDGGVMLPVEMMRKDNPDD